MEIEDLQEIMEVDLADLTKEFNRIKSISDPRNKVAAINSMLSNDNKLFKKANDHVGDYNSTLKELSEDEANDHKEPLALFNAKIRQMKDSLRVMLEQSQRELLLTQPEADKPVTSQGLEDKSKQVIKKTEGVQEQTINVITRMENQVAETEVIGQNVVTTLGIQGDKLGGIGDDLEIIREDIVSSRQLIKAIQKELQKDKCWRLLLFIVLLIGLILVIWAAVDKNFKHATKGAGGDGLASASDRCQGCASGSTPPPI